MEDDYQPMKFEFLYEDIMYIWDYNIPVPEEGPKLGPRWMMVFDGASNASGNDVGVVITSPEGFRTPFTAGIYFDFTNNMLSMKLVFFY